MSEEIVETVPEAVVETPVESPVNVEITQEVAPSPILPKLTVAQFIADLAKFPQDSELCGALFGIGMTIPIFQAISVQADGKPLTILQMSKEGAIRALQHEMDEQLKNIPVQPSEAGAN